METIINSLMDRAGARALFNSTTGRPLFAVVAGATTPLYREIQRVFPDLLFTTLNDAVAALDKVSTAAQSYANQTTATIFVAPGIYTITTAARRVIIPDTLSGLRIYFEQGAELSTSAILTAGDGLLEIEGRNVQLAGFPRLSTTNASQTGSALIVGGSAAGEGDAQRFFCENLAVGGLTAATDWAKPVVFRGVTDATLVNTIGAVIWGSTATTRIISVEAGNARNTINLRLVGIIARALTDSGNTCIPLSVDASQDAGSIIGGEYTTDGSGRAIVITAQDWSLNGGGLAGSTAMIGIGSHIDLVTATRIRIGLFYNKDFDANTAPTLFDQTNV